MLFAIYGAASPYLSILIKGLGYGPAAVGLFLGLVEVVGMLGPLVLAQAADKSGRHRPILLCCAVAVAASMAPLALLPRPLATGLALVLYALGLRSLTPIMDAATVAMGSGREDWDYGAFRALGSAGFVAAALALQLVPGFDRSPPGTMALAIGALAAAYGASLVSLPPPPRKAAPSTSARGGGELRKAKSLFALGLAVIALGRLAMSPINSFLSLYLVDEVKWDAVGWMWALAALAEVPLMILSGRIIGRLGPMGATALGTAAIALRLAIFAFLPYPAWVVVGQLLHSLCFGLLHPAAVAFVTRTVPPEKRTWGLAMYMGIGSGLPTFLGSALGGFIAQSRGYRFLFGSFIVFALASIALYLANRRRLSSV
jgi:Arabinose efflux permease